MTALDGSLRVTGNIQLPTCAVVELHDQILLSGPIGGLVENTDNNDPCDPDPCSTGVCQLDCAVPEDQVCQ